MTTSSARIPGDTFTRDLFGWLRRVATDQQLGALATRVAVLLSQYVNRQTGEAWPTQETLASELGASDRGIRKSLDELESRGHVSVSRGGFRARNRYRLDLADRNRRAGVIAAETGTAVPVCESSDRNRGSSETGTTVPVTPERQFLHNHQREPLQEPSDLFRSDRPASEPHVPTAASRSKAAAKSKTDNRIFDEQDWDRFWNLYPKKEERKAARRLYERVVRSGEATVDELFVGVTRYRARMAGQERRFIKTPTTWFNKGCWADEPASLSAERPDARHPSRDSDPASPRLPPGLAAAFGRTRP